jgi:hypothetical protein
LALQTRVEKTVTHDEYLKDPSPKPSLSSSIAKLLLTRSPLHAWMAHPRLNPNCVQEESAKFDIGSAAHALLLEGADRMAVIDAPDWRTNKAKELRDAARAEHKHPVLAHQYASVLKMVEVAQSAWNANDDLRGYTLSGEGGDSEHPILWHEGDTYFRAKLDRVSTDRTLIIDYKTTECAEPSVFLRQIVSMGYDIQAAFYERAVQKPYVKFVFLVQEIEPPFACSFIGMPPAFMELGRRKVEKAIAIWKECMASGKWPGYGNRILWAEPPAWEVAKWEAM